MSQAHPTPTPSPGVDDALNTVVCSVCQRKQRLGSRYCDMCGKRLSMTRINESTTAAASTTISPPTPNSSPTQGAHLSKRLWDRPLPAIAAARSSLIAVRTLHAFLSSLLNIENAYIAAVTKLTCQTNTDGMPAATAEAYSFFVQHHIDRVRGKYREVRKIERGMAALQEVLRGSEAALARMDKDVAEQQKALRKEVEALQKREMKFHKRHSQSQLRASGASSAQLPASQSFSRWKITAEADAKKGAAPQAAASAGGKEGTKLAIAQQAEHKARANHNAVVAATLNQLERLEQDKSTIIREVMLQLVAEISNDSMKAYHSSVAVRDKLDAVDPVQEVREWARGIESGVPCTWVQPSSGGEVKSQFTSALRTLREDSGARDSSGDTTPRSLSSRSLNGKLDSKTEPSTAQPPGALIIPRHNSVSIATTILGISQSSGSPVAAISSTTPPPAPPTARSGSIARPSPRVMSDSHHQLVVQPSRMLRLEHIATPTLASSTAASDYLPWLPPHPALATYHVEPRQWELLAVETLLLSPSFLTPVAQGPPLSPLPNSVPATALDVLRARVGLSTSQMEELIAALHWPYRSASPSSLNPLLSSVNYRLLLLRTVDESSFRSLKQFSAFFQRQCHAVLSCLLWHVVSAGGDGGVKEWHHNSKIYNQERIMAKLLDRVKGVLDVYCESGGDDYAQRRRDRCDRLAVLLDEVVRDLRHHQVRPKDNMLQRLMQMRGGGSKKDAQSHPDTPEDSVLFLPTQLRHNLYRQLVSAAMIKSSDSGLIHSRSPSSSLTLPGTDTETPTLPESKQGEKEVEEKMAVLHPLYPALLTVLSAFSAHESISPLFTSLAFIAVLLDVIGDQSVVQECAPLATPALRSSDTMLSLLEEYLGGLRARKDDEASAAAEAGDDSLTHFYTRSLQHFDSQFTVYLSHYHQSSPPLLLRVAELYARLLELEQPPSSSQSHELERVFLREKKVTRIVQRSVTAEYSRVRAAFEGRVEARHWRSIAEEVEVIARRERDSFHRALMPITHTSLDMALPTLSSLFVTDVNAALAEHPSADAFFISLVPALAHLNATFMALASSLSDSYLLTSTLPDLQSVVPSHLRHLVSQQVTNIQQWVSTHVDNETWEAVDDAVGCSSSVIDTYRLLHSTVDTFFAAFTPLLPQSLLVLPFFFTSLNECINAYATLLHMSCGEEASGRPPPTAPDAASSFTSPSAVAGMLTRAVSLLTDKMSPKGHVTALSQHTLSSLCVRLCNISAARERLTQLQAHVLALWSDIKTQCDPRYVPDLERTETELQLVLPSAAGDGSQEADDAHPAELFSSAWEHLEQCSTALLSLIASRAVFIEWHTPLLTVLYYPLPSSPAVSFRDSGLMELLDSTMLDLYKQTGDTNFAGVCEWVWRYLLQAMEWTLIGRDRGKGAGLLEPGVIGEADVAVLQNDVHELRELFVDDLGAERMAELSTAYEALLQKLRYRVQNNQITAK